MYMYNSQKNTFDIKWELRAWRDELNYRNRINLWMVYLKENGYIVDQHDYYLQYSQQLLTLR